MSLHIESTGQGPALVLLHGWGLHSAIWQPLIERLSGHYRVTTVDLPGHGLSALPPGEFDLKRMALLILNETPQPATWIGWSLGGMVALQAALLHPAAINRVIAVATLPQFVQSDDWPYAMPQKTLTQFSTALKQDSSATLQLFMTLQMRGTQNERQQLRHLHELLLSRPQASSEALRLGLEILRNTDLRPVLHQLRPPAQFIFGKRDQLVPIAAKAELEKLLPTAHYEVITGAGHIPFLSHPEQFLAALNSFINNEHL